MSPGYSLLKIITNMWKANDNFNNLPSRSKTKKQKKPATFYFLSCFVPQVHYSFTIMGRILQIPVGE